MEIHFEVTFDDFLDAISFQHRRHARQRQKLRKTLRVFLLIETGLVAIVLSAVWLVSGRLFFTSFSLRGVVESAAMSSLPVVPWLELLLFLAIAGMSLRIPRRAKWILLASLGAIIASAVVLFSLAVDYEHAMLRRLLARSGSTVAPWGSLPNPFGVANLFGWVAMFLICLLTTGVSANAGKRLWNQQPNLRRPKTVQFREDGFRVTDEFSTRNYQWSGIEKAVDARSQLLLYYNKVSFEIIPKRAFDSERALDQFWRFAAVKGEAASQGFPVRAVIPV